jgi:hypothetical protein
MKIRNLTFRTKEIEPKWFTLIFLIDDTYKKHQGAFYCLEDAIKDAATFKIKGASDKTLFWHFTNTAEEIRNSFKYTK